MRRLILAEEFEMFLEEGRHEWGHEHNLYVTGGHTGQGVGAGVILDNGQH